MRCRYIIVMSDGIFEFMENDEVVGMVHAAALAGVAPCEAAKRLVREARRCVT